MMPLQKRFMVLFVLLMLFSGSVWAQEGAADFSEDELDGILYVSKAFENMHSVYSYASSAEQLIDQRLETQGIVVTQIIDQAIESIAILDEDNPAMSATVVQNLATDMGTGSFSIDMTMDMILVDEIFYIRVSEASDEVRSMFPSDWVNVTDNPGAVPGMELINLDQFTQLSNSALQYPISADTLESFAELEGETLGDIDMRVFEMRLSSAGLLASEEFEQVKELFNPGAGDVDVDAMMTQMFDGANIEMKIWIGAEDQLVYQVEMVMNIDADIDDMIPGAGTVNLVQDLTGTYVFSDFDAEFEIEAPIEE